MSIDEHVEQAEKFLREAEALYSHPEYMKLNGFTEINYLLKCAEIHLGIAGARRA